MAFDQPFYFLRHGETSWNAARLCQGQLDSPLNATGRAQAEAAAEALAAEPIERIVASPLSRARHTAEAVGRRLGLPVSCEAGLMECHLGAWQGTTHGPWLGEYFRGEADPVNGETFGAFTTRVWTAMASAVARGPNTLIVAHGGLWIAAREHVQVTPEMARMPNALPLHVTPGDGLWTHRVCGGAEAREAVETY